MRYCSLIASPRRAAWRFAAAVGLFVAATVAAQPTPLTMSAAAQTAILPAAPGAITPAAPSSIVLNSSSTGATTPATSSNASSATTTSTGSSSASTASASTTSAVSTGSLANAVDVTSPWSRTLKETAIWSGYDANAKEFARIAASIPVQVMEFNGTRALVYFPGDNKGHKAGQVWIDKADLADMPWPRWARARTATSIRVNPDVAAEELSPLSLGSYVEISSETQGRWAKAFFLADGKPGEFTTGWVDGLDLRLPSRGDQAEMGSYVLTRASLSTTTPDVWLKVPYRSQLDGTAYAEANCGPTSVAMALAALGNTDTQESIRAAALKLQNLNGCDDCGTYIQHLAMVAEARGARTFGLRDDGDTSGFHDWTMDDIRAQLRQDRVVIPQVQFRSLPGRTKLPYGGDHYIVIVGIAGNNFVYNDPVDSDGRGYGRLITAEQLSTAMSSAHGEFSRAAFAVGK